ncbi:MAG: hypothetical protein GF353_17115 [Candidatus Lokiarchaeota archaeon]|nr:hypothetical protein [Candidatus Lokiarchaeota archaeon]
MQTIRYMGSKRKLASIIYQLINNEIQLNGDDYFFDLFAGTNSVAEVFKNDCPIVTNDIQEYSYQIALALIKNKDTKIDSSDLKMLNHIALDKFHSLSNRFDIYSEIENRLISEKKINEYSEFLKSFPHVNNANIIKNHELSYLFTNNALQSYKEKKEYLLFTTYFNNTYFSLRQCLHIDSLRFAIDNITDGWHNDNTMEIKRSIYLTCLMSALSISVNSTSHFAQYHKLNKKNLNWIAERRKKDIFQIFNHKLNEFNDSLIPTKFTNICLKKDYKLVFKENEDLLNKTKLVYIDPPYSCAPYSRFYHILETLVKYDYPESLYDGRYRGDRYVSDFNKKSKVSLEFKSLLENLINYKLDVLFSYPLNNDLNYNAESLLELCNYYYKPSNIVVKKIPHKRQAFGNKNAKNGQTEYLILCKNI